VRSRSFIEIEVSAMRRSFVRIPLALLLTLALGVSACDDDPLGPVLPEDVEFDASLGVNLSQMTKLESGVYIQTRVAGTGVGAVNGDVLVVDYTLWLPSGSEIESQSGWEYTLGAGTVISGFEDGLGGVREGETRLIVIPSDQAYGLQGRGDIPPQSVLVFEVVITAKNPPA
jgi:FKBP-type peptidyl-prolyl cis-trans isomerase FkpA